MIVDSSAIIAILFDELEAKLFFDLIVQSKLTAIAAPTLLEASIVTQTRKGAIALQKLDQLLSRLDIRILDFRAVHAEAAKFAFLKYGKGQGHKAQLNFGDCMSYATSKVEGMPLLFTGDDFRLTDVEVAL